MPTDPTPLDDSAVNALPGNETVGRGVNIINVAYSTPAAPVGGLKGRIFDLGNLKDGQDWTFAPTQVVYRVAPGLETPSGGSTAVTTYFGSSRTEFTQNFNVIGKISGSYMAFSGQLAASYETSQQNDQEYSYVFVLQDGLTWSVALNMSKATLVTDFVDDVNNLPTTFEKNNAANVLTFTRFFEEWGTSFVSTANVGGRLYYYAAVDKAYQQSQKTITASLTAEWKGLTASVKVQADSAWSQVDSSWTETRDSKVVSVGPGSQEIPFSAFLSPPYNEEPGVETDLIAKWQQAVNQGPGTVGASLSDITLAVEQADKTKVAAVQAALQFYTSRSIQITTSPDSVPTNMSVLVNGIAVQFNNAPGGQPCGIMAVVLDRSSLQSLWAQYYEPSSVTNDLIFDYTFLANMRQDIAEVTDGDQEFIIVLASYGVDAARACPTIGDPDYYATLQSWGGGQGLSLWSDIGPSGMVQGSYSGQTPEFAYILIGANGLGYGNGVELTLDGPVNSGDPVTTTKAIAYLLPGDNGANGIRYTPYPY